MHCQTTSWRRTISKWGKPARNFSAVLAMSVKIGLIDWWTTRWKILCICKAQKLAAHTFLLVAARICANLKKECDFIFIASLRRSSTITDLCSGQKSRSWVAKAIFYHRRFINKDAQGCLSLWLANAIALIECDSAPPSASFLFIFGWRVKVLCKQTAKHFLSSIWNPKNYFSINEKHRSVDSLRVQSTHNCTLFLRFVSVSA